MFPLWRSKPQTGTVSDTRGHTSGQTDFLRHLPASSPLFDVSHIKVSEESETGRLSPSSVIYFILLQIMERVVSSHQSAGFCGQILWMCRGNCSHSFDDADWVTACVHSEAFMQTLSAALTDRKPTASTFVCICLMWRIHSVAVCSLTHTHRWLCR